MEGPLFYCGRIPRLLLVMDKEGGMRHVTYRPLIGWKGEDISLHKGRVPVFST